MNFLQISYGDQILRRMEYVNSVLDSLRDDDTYTLIADENRLNDSRVKWINAQEYEDSIISKYEPIKRMWDVKRNDGKIKFADKADIIRIHYGSLNADTLYIDTDIMLFKGENTHPKKSSCFLVDDVHDMKELSDSNGLPCYGATPSNGIDDGLYYNGQCLDFYRQWFEWMLTREKQRAYQPFGWYFKYIVGKSNITQPIKAKGFFRHYRK